MEGFCADRRADAALYRTARLGQIYAAGRTHLDRRLALDTRLTPRYPYAHCLWHISCVTGRLERLSRLYSHTGLTAYERTENTHEAGLTSRI